MDDLAQQAIHSAISGNWELAEKLNKKILAGNPKDLETLNRLARAQMELGKLQEAQKVYKKVLALDRYNPIALRGFGRLKKIKTQEAPTPALETYFLEEPGKTKTISLIHLGDEKTLVQLDSGEELKLVPGRHRISVVTLSGKYVGRLPDDISARLLKFIRGGNEYLTLVKSVEPDQVKIFIREMERAKAFANLPTFPLIEKLGYVAFTPPELVHEERPSVSTLEEEEEEDQSTNS